MTDSNGLAASEEAVKRCLDAFATSLHDRGVLLRKAERWEEAFETIAEAVQLRRRLALAHEEDFGTHLARSLHSLAAIFTNWGRWQKALESIHEAVLIHRRLVQRRPEEFLPELAKSLVQLGDLLKERLCREEGLEAIQEAVQINRALAQRSPEEFLPELARSLVALDDHLKWMWRPVDGVELDDLWNWMSRREEGLAAIQEAVQIHRELAQRRPEEFEPELARSLWRWSFDLGALHRREEELVVTAEAEQLDAQIGRRRGQNRTKDCGLESSELVAPQPPDQAYLDILLRQLSEEIPRDVEEQ